MICLTLRPSAQVKSYRDHLGNTDDEYLRRLWLMQLADLVLWKPAFAPRPHDHAHTHHHHD